MIQIKIDKKLCNECGECDLILPGIWKKATAQGGLMVSDTNAEIHGETIQRLFNHCHIAAMKIEEVPPCASA